MNEEEKILIDGQEVINAINNLAKDANDNHRNRAYWKGLRDAYRAVLYLIEREVQNHGSNETSRHSPQPERDGVEGNEPG